MTPSSAVPPPAGAEAEVNAPNWPKDPDAARRKAAIAARKNDNKDPTAAMRPLSPQQTLSTIPVSNDADALAGTCNGRYLVVVGTANSMKPVSLVDMVTKTEVGTYTFNGLSAAVSVADPGTLC